MVNPGNYTAKLTVEGKSLSVPMKILLDRGSSPAR